MPELEADVRAPELVHGNGQFQQLRPPGTVVVIQDEGVVLARQRLSRAEGDKVLPEKTGLFVTAPLKDYFGSRRAIALLSLPAPQVASTSRDMTRQPAVEVSF